MHKTDCLLTAGVPCTELDTDLGDGVSGIDVPLFPGVLNPTIASPSTPPPPLLPVDPACPPLPFPLAPLYRPPMPLAMSVRAGVTNPCSVGQVDEAVEVDPSVLMEEFDPLLRSSEGFSRSDRSSLEESSSSDGGIGGPAETAIAGTTPPPAVADGLGRSSEESSKVSIEACSRRPEVGAGGVDPVIGAED